MAKYIPSPVIGSTNPAASPTINKFFDLLIGLENLYFNWNKNKFLYKYNHKKINFLNINEKNNLIKYLKNKNDPFEKEMGDAHDS